MPQSAFDMLRALAIGSQALGLTLIITLETVLGDEARPWQGVVLAVMVASALIIALVRLYRNKRLQKHIAERRRAVEDEEER
ncbi:MULTISPECIES: hypothetical protein [Vreelandella]|uniref:Uncharacterized protein n=2 Tax=Vreelandella TaxID=3137766 RepID=A0A7C9NME7_9GAMM|nr:MULTISPECIES: hypothetical protein [Halomonas]NDL70009.1 hypothetical protein [Halomonas alkaliphila]NYS45986.1 hypothetical protein [Halomonas zhaodongensis]